MYLKQNPVRDYLFSASAKFSGKFYDVDVSISGGKKYHVFRKFLLEFINRLSHIGSNMGWNIAKSNILYMFCECPSLVCSVRHSV